jgi:pimeloyl-ACP methyl ester carboxylesterase
MKRCIAVLSMVASFALCGAASAQITSKVVDIPTREGVTQRFVYLAPDKPRKAVILFSGGSGGLQITPDGVFTGGEGNFLVRSRMLFASHGLAVAVVDAPSDHQQPPFLSGFRMTPQHATDIKAVIAWLRQSGLPVWLVGTSRGTQSAAYVATQLAADGGPDGLVLTSTVLTDRFSLPVPAMPVDKLTIPVLVVHHEQDACKVCAYGDVPVLMARLAPVPVKELITFTGGITRGDPCQAKAHHGYNGIEAEVVAKIADWIDTH